MRICFNPFSIGKSYVSLLERPFLNIEYDVKIGEWHINRIPFVTFLSLFLVQSDCQTFHRSQTEEKDALAKKDNTFNSFGL